MMSFPSVLPLDSEARFFFVQVTKRRSAMSVLIGRGPCTERHDRRPGHDRSRFGRIYHYVLAALLCATCSLQFVSTAAAQCAARDVLQKQLKLGLRQAQAVQRPVESARDIATWKTIAIGTFADPIRLRNALDAAGCNVGGQAAEILARPAFTVSSQRMDVELVTVSPAQLGLMSDTVPLANVYARARQLGLELAAAEVGPQLRMQYFDQPMGEFLTIAMEPIKTWSGELIILNVANGGAGLILIGQDGRAGAEIPAATRFVFARPHRSAPGTELVEQAEALQPR